MENKAKAPKGRVVANTNEPPIFLGRYMMFSDQDLTSLKHNLVGQALISTVFVGLLTVVSNPRIPLIVRMMLMAGMITGLHAATIAVWNLIQSHIQLHPKCHPAYLYRKLVEFPLAYAVVTACITLLAIHFAPSLTSTIKQTAEILSAGLTSK